ncbi:choline-sulfatase [Nocardioides jensenii]|uniref:choline-sulfatase n=1 Tax=Nocardioides jensenii TaxID=1843 RepID=UPI00082E89D4|nr:choline-sulfatase [Nocardioides jensenii]
MEGRTGQSQPNVLVVMFDQVAPSALRCYGNPVTVTPTIDHLARTGVVFDAAYSNSPLCTPARYCMMTGQLPSGTGGYDNAAYMPSTQPTLAHYARLAGYRTVLDGKMHFVGPDQLHGFEERRTTDIYPADFGWTPNWLQPDERIDWWMHNMDSVKEAGTAEVTNQLLYDDEVGHQGIRALHDLARADDERPWLLVVSFTHPHDPYVTRSRYWDLYDGVDIPLPTVGRDDVPLDPHTERLRRLSAMDAVEITAEDTRRARRAYYSNISYLDEWTGRLMSTLDALQVRDDTIVVLLADHGDMLGERGLWYKMSFFEDSARIPMIVNAPGRFAPKRVADPVSLVDVLPTITELAGDGVPPSVMPLAGRSLIDLCGDRPLAQDLLPREVVGEYCGEGAIAPILMIRQGDLKFVHSPVDPDQLYDLAADPLERRNLVDEPGLAGAVASLRRRVADEWDLDALYDDVVADQSRRRLVDTALRLGTVTPWEYTPPADASGQYMRNHLDLNDVERGARFPPAPGRGRTEDPRPDESAPRA